MSPHQVYRREIAGASRAVLFIHGIVGSPDHFRDFYPRVPADWSICSMLIGGHGGTTRAFSRSSMAAWQRQVAAQVDELAQGHASLFLVGHSMGTLLALGQALKRPDLVRGLFLLAVPLKARMTFRAVRQSTRVALGLDPRGDPVLEAARAAYSIEPDRRVWRYLGYIPRYLELLRLMQEIREALPGLQVPGQVFMSSRDEIVSPASAVWLEGQPLLELEWLEHSDHKYYPKADKDYLLDRFESFCIQGHDPA